MKTLVSLLIACVVFLTACGPKSYADTSVGKKKWKYYNKTQYGLQPKKSLPSGN